MMCIIDEMTLTCWMGNCLWARLCQELFDHSLDRLWLRKGLQNSLYFDRYDIEMSLKATTREWRLVGANSIIMTPLNHIHIKQSYFQDEASFCWEEEGQTVWIPYTQGNDCIIWWLLIIFLFRKVCCLKIFSNVMQAWL